MVTAPTPPTPTPSVAASTGGGDDDGAAEGSEAGDIFYSPGGTPPALPDTLPAADFRREVGQIQRSLRTRCPGLPGFEVGAKVYVEPSGKVSRVVPEGRQAGSSFSACVVKLVRQARFKKARKDSVHSATFRI